tara:strand:+ start:48 stop:305 length:258 start_codon:yes stop_codon:yes gene_type:complete
MAIQTGTIAATGAKDSITLGGEFSLSLRDFGTATVVLERSLGGNAWGVVESFTADTEKVGDSNGDLFRLNCTAYTSGTIAYTLQS